MFFDGLFFVIGLALMALAGDVLVRGAVGVGRRLNIAPLLVGIIIIGFGTSLPEMLVTIQAGFNGYPELALGNIVGSNISNILLVLALPALICPIGTHAQGNVLAGFWMLAATCVWVGYGFGFPLHMVFAVICVVGLMGYLAHTCASVDTDSISDADLDGSVVSLVWAIPMCLFGLVVLPLAAHLVVIGGTALASGFGVSDEIIGLTLLAVGTSLPEIGAGMAAALRGRTHLIMGNVLGSNVFNIFGSGALLGLFGPVSMTAHAHNYTHWIMVGSAIVLLAYILRRRNIGRLSALGFLAIYALYLGGLIQNFEVLQLVKPVPVPAL